MKGDFIQKSDEMTTPSAKKEVKRYITVILSALAFSFSVNVFIVPMGLYNGGVLGIAQILRTVIERAAGGAGGRRNRYSGYSQLCHQRAPVYTRIPDYLEELLR